MASKTTYPVNPAKSSSSRSRRSSRRAKDPNSAESKRELRRQISQSVGNTARGARQRAKLTQADVAERIGVATEVYGRLERGLLMPSVPTLRRLCLALSMGADAMLSLGPNAPDWGQPPQPPPAKEDAQMRRLMRHVRRLNPLHLRALSVVAAMLGRAQ